MNSIEEEILLLLDKYTSDTCSDDEKDRLFNYLSSGKYDTLLQAHIQNKLEEEHIQENGVGLNEQSAVAILERILNYANRKQNIQQSKKTYKHPVYMLKWVAAACIIFACAVGAWIYFNNKVNHQIPYIASLNRKESRKEVENTTDKTLKLLLEDGSTVTLQPRAKLIYPATFSGSVQREVYLEGDAYFEIARNPLHPFLVYHSNLITKVLGTKFFIKQDAGNKQVEVNVRSGKVEVFENPSLLKKKSIKENDGVIITLNQRVIYAEDKRLFSTTVVEVPLPTLESDSENKKGLKYDSSMFEYKAVPLKQIVPVIEEYYGIKIEIENEALNNCLFTGDLSAENLYTKLEILCGALGSTYEVKGVNILIKGYGCNKYK